MPDPAPNPLAPKSKVYFGIVFDFDGTEIPLEPKSAIDEIKTNGIECGLKPGQRINLGKVGQRLSGLFGTLGITNAADYFDATTGKIKDDKLPDIAPLKNAVNLLTDADLTIENFHIKLPGSQTTDKTKYYTVGLSAVWVGPDAGKLIDGVDLKLKGVFFRVSNEPPPKLG